MAKKKGKKKTNNRIQHTTNKQPKYLEIPNLVFRADKPGQKLYQNRTFSNHSFTCERCVSTFKTIFKFLCSETHYMLVRSKYIV